MTPKTDPVAVLREMRDSTARAQANAGNAMQQEACARFASQVAALDAAIAALSAQGEAVGEVIGYGSLGGEPRASLASGLAPGTKLYAAPPGADAVAEEEISWLAMEAASFIDNEYQHGRARPNAHRIREHLRAALAATAPAGMDRPEDIGEGIDYRVVSLGDAYEPQMRYTSGQGVWTWFPLMANGYWLEPEAFSYGDVTQRSPMSESDAERAILRARAINGHHIAPANAASTPPATAGQEPQA